MELWIRSQDKKYLIKTEYLYIAYDEENQQAYIGDKMVGHIGTYKSKERALEVLDEIQNILVPRTPKAIIGKDIKIIPLSTYVYEMPEN